MSLFTICLVRVKFFKIVMFSCAGSFLCYSFFRIYILTKSKMTNDKCCGGKLEGVFPFLMGLIVGAVIVGVLVMSGHFDSLEGKVFGVNSAKNVKTTNLYIGVDKDGAWVQTLEAGDAPIVEASEDDLKWVESGDSVHLEEGEGAWVQTMTESETEGAWVQTLSPETNDAWVQTLR